MSQSFQIQWKIPEDLPFFAGHFPDNPIVPGFAIVDRSCDWLREVNPDLPVGMRVQNAKFSRPLTPGMAITVKAENDGRRWTIRWSESATDEELALLNLSFG